MFVGLLAHSFATILNFQWFSMLPSPLNGMVALNHWDQWFSNGFGVRQPLIMMVFDGWAPLVRRWNGYIPSSKSIADDKQPNSKKHGIFLHIVFGKRGQRVGMYLKFNFCLLSKFKVLFMHQLSCLGRPLLLGGDFDSTLIFAENNSLSRISILGH